MRPNVSHCWFPPLTELNDGLFQLSTADDMYFGSALTR